MSQPGVEIGSGMPSRPLPGLSSALPGDDDLVARRVVDDARLDRMARRARPSARRSRRARSPCRCGRSRGSPPARRPRPGCRICGLLAVDDVGEQERLAVLLLDAAAELPAHQRVHLGVLVDRAIDGDEQPGLVERAQVVVQVRIAAFRCGGGAFRCRLRRGFALRLRQRIHSCFLFSSQGCDPITVLARLNGRSSGRGLRVAAACVEPNRAGLYSIPPPFSGA